MKARFSASGGEPTNAEMRRKVQEAVEGPAARFRQLPKSGLDRRFNFKVKSKASVGELYLYDQIGVDWFGGIGAKDVITALESMKDCSTLNIYINSPGGDVFEATAIYNLIERHPAKKKRCFIDGLAASAASYIPMVGTEIITGANAMWMIHNPWSVAMGESEDLRKAADMLDQVRELIVDTYARRTNQSKDDLRKWMDAETWMDAKTAKERGFTDGITGADQCNCSCPECRDGECADCSCDNCAACQDGECDGCGAGAMSARAAMGSFSLLNQYKNTPSKLRAVSSSQRVRLAEAEAYTLRMKSTGPARK